MSSTSAAETSIQAVEPVSILELAQAGASAAAGAAAAVASAAAAAVGAASWAMAKVGTIKHASAASGRINHALRINMDSLRPGKGNLSSTLNRGFPTSGTPLCNEGATSPNRVSSRSDGVANQWLRTKVGSEGGGGNPLRGLRAVVGYTAGGAQSRRLFRAAAARKMMVSRQF